MKRVYQLKTLFFLVTAVLGLTLFNACNPDEEPPIVFGPNASSTLNSSATLNTGDTIFVTLSATKGDNPMNAIEVRRNGSLVDLTEVFFNGTQAAANPRLLFDAEKDEFTYDIGVLVHASGDADYDFIVTDEGSESSTDSYTITVNEVVEPTDPEITLSGNGAYMAAAEMLAGFRISVDANGVDLSTLEIQEAGTAINEAEGLYIINIDPVNDFGTNNPLDLPAQFVGGMTDVELFVRAHNTSNTTVTYTVIVTNVNGEMDSQDFTITTSGTDIDATYTGVLLENAAGPNPTGGMNLSNGTTVSVNSSDADIIDQGIDGNGDWLQQIGTANGTNLKALSQAQIDAGFSFDNVLYKEEITQGFNESNDVAGGISEVVAEGDVFFVNDGNDFYVIKCTLIETTSMDNLDKYEFDIKKADF